ncbi:MAG: hypothetical protein GEU98_19680, partial [Pseudonocardiaceae bacterium]|nr:hypothetical protein [Pseudonocardiaceae bacterium]
GAGAGGAEAGAGGRTGAMPGGAMGAGEGAAAKGGAAGSAAGRGGGMPMGAAGAGRGQGGEDDEHQRASFLVEDDPHGIFGTDEKTAPPVIGE